MYCVLLLHIEINLTWLLWPNCILIDISLWIIDIFVKPCFVQIFILWLRTVFLCCLSLFTLKLNLFLWLLSFQYLVYLLLLLLEIFFLFGSLLFLLLEFWLFDLSLLTLHVEYLGVLFQLFLLSLIVLLKYVLNRQCTLYHILEGCNPDITIFFSPCEQTKFSVCRVNMKLILPVILTSSNLPLFWQVTLGDIPWRNGFELDILITSVNIFLEVQFGIKYLQRGCIEIHHKITLRETWLLKYFFSLNHFPDITLYYKVVESEIEWLIAIIFP